MPHWGKPGFHYRVVDAGESFQNGLKDYLRAFTWDRHSNLSSHRLLATHELKVVRESLKSSPLPISQRAVFTPMIHVGSTTPASCNCIRRAIRVKPFIYLAYFSSHDIQFKMLWELCIECVLTRFNVLESLNYGLRLPGQFVIERIFGNWWIFNRISRRNINVIVLIW